MPYENVYTTIQLLYQSNTFFYFKSMFIMLHLISNHFASWHKTDDHVTKTTCITRFQLFGLHCISPSLSSCLPVVGLVPGPVPCAWEKQYEAENHAQGEEGEREVTQAAVQQLSVR